jgi:hypothetical protein
MAIPDLNDNGLLPEGIHEASESELFERFRYFRSTTRRLELSSKLKTYLEEIRESRLHIEVLVDGSFVTSKDDPNDIDLILILPEDFNFDVELSPYVSNVISARQVRRRYGFDVLVAVRRTPQHDIYIDDFQNVKGRPDLRKGIVRISE